MKMLFLTLLVSLSLPVMAMDAPLPTPEAAPEEPVLKAGIQWTEEKARIEAFRGVPNYINMRPYRIRAKALLKEDPKKYSITWYSGSFVIAPYDEKVAYIYALIGTKKTFLGVQIFEHKLSEEIYPQRSATYHDFFGVLDSTQLYVSRKECYGFSRNGKLKAHWKDTLGYDKKGRLIGFRYFTEH